MNRYNIGLKQRLEEYLSNSTEPLQDTSTKEDRVSNAMEVLERLRTSNIFDRARESTPFTRPPDSQSDALFSEN